MKHSAKYIVAIVVLAVAAAVLLQIGGNQTISGQATGYCYDSDGGMKLDVRGRVNNEKSGSVIDSCANSKTLIENYCAGTEGKSKQVNCVREGFTKCDGGRCVR